MTSYLSQKFQYLTSFSSEPEDVKEGELNSENRQELEQSKLIIMKSLIEKQDPSAKDVDELMMRRFLRARDLDVEKATDMLIKYLKWRIEFVPNGHISPSEIRNDLAQNKLFMQGYDKTGSPILVVLAARRKPTPVPEFKRFVTYVLDKVCARMPSGQEKFTFIADLDGWGFANNDMHGSLAALSILQDCYPERLGKMFVVNVPYIFMTVWKMLYPFIDKKTKKKINFVENDKLQQTLLQDIDESQLANIFGGTLELVPIQDC